MSDELTVSTRAEHAAYVAAGCEPLTPAEYRARVEALGYALETDPRRSNAVGRYVNRGNAQHYRAFGVTYRDRRTGRGYANIYADRTRLAELQRLRRDSVVMVSGWLWEL